MTSRNELHPVKYTVKQLKVSSQRYDTVVTADFGLMQMYLAGICVFYAAKYKSCFSIGVRIPRLR